MQAPNITITEPAQQYLRELLAKQDSPGIGVRIFVEKPGTPQAECCMAYCPLGEQEAGDVRIELEGLTAFIQSSSAPFLEDAVIDYNPDRFGGQLTFKAPKSKVPQIREDASVEEQINYVLYAEINPSLASHNGNVSLVEIVDEGETAVLKFGGGCQGCGMVDMTLKDGVERTLLERVPSLKRVIDTTDHSKRENAYFK
ncbi:MAG TPA: Fe-S biogenesis protein NfuA [Pseudomonadales bacterium]|nr:Fe-S biogenesis protein NfuA [Pseudomonadales bacterium]